MSTSAPVEVRHWGQTPTAKPEGSDPFARCRPLSSRGFKGVRVATLTPAWCLCLVLAISLGCTSAYTAMKPVADATLRQTESRQFTKVLVVTQDGHEMELALAALAGDSLVGGFLLDVGRGVAEGLCCALTLFRICK
jgi:hypothetical protein